jgi:hypothetical protein
VRLEGLGKLKKSISSETRTLVLYGDVGIIRVCIVGANGRTCVLGGRGEVRAPIKYLVTLLHT